MFKNSSSLLAKELTHYLSVDSRLSLPQNEQMNNALVMANNLPDLLDRNASVVRNINKLFGKLFFKCLYVIAHTAPKIELRFSDSSSKPPPSFHPKNRERSANNYSDWIEQNNIGYITQEGHGIRAFLNIMMAYFIPTNKILMIDEPEIHLYPSIKRKFGNQIGKLSMNEKQFFCVTHDSDFMQGVISSGCEVTVIRLSKSKDDRLIHDVKYDKKINLNPPKARMLFYKSLS